MNYFKVIALSLCTVLILFSCRKKELSSLVDQNAIYMNLQLDYNEFQDRTLATARFYLDGANGKRLELSQNSRIFYADQELETATRRGTRYTAQLNGYWGGFNYDWNDTKKKTYQNQVDIPALIYARSQSTTHFGFFSYDFYFEGDSIGLNEEIVLELEVDQDTSFTITVTETKEGRHFVRIPAWDMDDLAGYTARVTITRRKFSPIQEAPGAGGEIQSSYTQEGTWFSVW